MKRRRFNIPSQVSPVLCGMVIMVWAWSLFHRVEWSWTDKQGVSYFIVLDTNSVRWASQAVSTGITPLGELDTGAYGTIRLKPNGQQRGGQITPPLTSDYRFLAFEYGDHPEPIAIPFPGPQTTAFTVFFHVLAVPYWSLLLLAALQPSWRVLRRYRARRRQVRGLCATCGYDIRASEERCPECGTVIVRP